MQAEWRTMINYMLTQPRTREVIEAFKVWQRNNRLDQNLKNKLQNAINKFNSSSVISTRSRLKNMYSEHKRSSLRTFENRKGRTKNNFKTLVSYMHANPLRVNTNLYRGTTATFIKRLLTNGYLDNNRVTPFTRNKNIAQTFIHGYVNGSRNNTGKVLILKPGRYPAINERRYNEKSYENEVTLAPGRYTLVGVTPNGNLKVNYTPAPLIQSIRL